MQVGEMTPPARGDANMTTQAVAESARELLERVEELRDRL